MLANVSTEIIRELKQKSRTFRAKIYRKSTGELLTENVRALNCTAASSDGSDVTVGQAFPRALTFSCNDIGLKEGDEIEVVIALKIRSNFVGGDMPFGEFTITNAVKGLDGIDYTAYDKLYINSTKDVTSLSTNFDSACTAIGNLIGAPFSKADSDIFPYGSNSQSHLSAIKELDENAGYKALEIAGFLAGLVGCNAFINRNGNLVFKAQQDVNIGYALDDRIEDKTLEFQVTIGSIEVRGARGAEDVYTLNRSNSKGAKLYVENPLAMSAQDVAWIIDNRMTHGADIVNKGTLVMKLGDPRIDPWDIIDNYACSALTMEFDGGISTNIESIVKTDQERSIEEKDRIKQVRAELEAMQSTVDDVASGFGDLETEVGEIGGGLDELGGTVNDLSGEVDLMGDSIEDLEDEVETIQSNYQSFLADYQAFKKMAEAGLGSTTGYYKTEQKVNGATVTYMHDQPQLSNSTYIWKFTIDSIACSIDGGKTYPFGMTVDGQLVQKYITSDYISSLNISAGAIKSGTMSCDRLSGGTISGSSLEIGSTNKSKLNSNGSFQLGGTNGIIYDGSGNITLGNNVKLSWSNISDANNHIPEEADMSGYVRENILENSDLLTWTKPNSATVVKYDSVNEYYKIYNPSSSNTDTSWYGIRQNLVLKPNTTYTLSFTSCNGYAAVTAKLYTTETNSGSSGIVTYTQDGKHEVTLKTSSNNIYLGLYVGAQGNKVCCIKEIKLEEGSGSTGWVATGNQSSLVTSISQHEISTATIKCDQLESTGTISGPSFVSTSTEPDTDGSAIETSLRMSTGIIRDSGAKSLQTVGGTYYTAMFERGGLMRFYSSTKASDVEGTIATCERNATYKMFIDGKGIIAYYKDGTSWKVILQINLALRTIVCPTNFTMNGVTVTGYPRIGDLYGNGEDLPSTNLNSVRTPGVYKVPSSDVTNSPSKNIARLEVIQIGTSYYRQIVHSQARNSVFWMRTYDGSSWGSWYRFAGTEVTS